MLPRRRRIAACLLTVCSFSITAVHAEHMVPFKGTWTGVTISADPTDFPVVAVVSAGGGRITHLGRNTMISPHTTNVITGETIGEQIFTAANGDTLTAHCEGSPAFQPDGTVVGSLECTFTSGTGRFAGATGGYEFFLVASPRTDGGPGFETVADINGSISSVGSSK
jgi:hypothetical protein